MSDKNDVITSELKAFEQEGAYMESLEEALSNSPLFTALPATSHEKIASHAKAVHLSKGQVLMKKGEESTCFYLVCRGEVSILTGDEETPVAVATIGKNESIGEMGVLLGRPRSATAVASTDAILARFSKEVFEYLFGNLPGFGLAISTYLARRLAETSWSVTHKDYRKDSAVPTPEVFTLLPLEFIQRHRVMPLRVEGNRLTLGVMEVSVALLKRVESLLSGMEVVPVRMDARLFERSVAHYESSAPTGPSVEAADLEPSGRVSPALVRMLKRMVTEGASDLHLSAGHKPRWRVDGNIREMFDLKPLQKEEVYELMAPILRPEVKQEFDETADCDFSYALNGVARFRVNMFRDRLGVGAVLRLIPEKILSIEQLGLPDVVRTLSHAGKGLILVTGPTGSGKSTTLAAMVDYINKTFPLHILTMEDPIEFVHQSAMCLVNQREMGNHSTSFAAALRASLREDPDIVLVGELRDRETVELALELANTGHLVLGTLHTSTAVSTIDRVVDLFPAEQQGQVRAGLADSLQGIIAQTLCRKKGGGRVAALEILVNSYATANLIREGKSSQIFNAMLTGKKRGNAILNDALTHLVVAGKVTAQEAMSKAVDKVALEKQFQNHSISF